MVNQDDEDKKGTDNSYLKNDGCHDGAYAFHIDDSTCTGGSGGGLRSSI